MRASGQAAPVASSDRVWVGCVGAVLFSRGFQIWAARVFNSGQVLFANFFLFYFYNIYN
jgi:hypothetical protein